MRTISFRFGLVIALCALTALTACRRRSNAIAPGATEAPSAPVAMPAGAPPAAPAAQGGATRETHDANYIQEMTSTLNDFLADYTRQHKRVPKDINEMMSLKLITSIPVLPGGKKWVINQQTGKISAQ
jgi:hypothetical protein